MLLVQKFAALDDLLGDLRELAPLRARTSAAAQTPRRAALQRRFHGGSDLADVQWLDPVAQRTQLGGALDGGRVAVGAQHNERNVLERAQALGQFQAAAAGQVYVQDGPVGAHAAGNLGRKKIDARRDKEQAQLRTIAFEAAHTLVDKAAFAVSEDLTSSIEKTAMEKLQQKNECMGKRHIGPSP